MAAALQTPRHTHIERARKPTQHVMAPKIVVSRPRCHTGSLGAGYTNVDDWQAFMRLEDRLRARQHSFYEISFSNLPPGYTLAAVSHLSTSATR